MGRALPKRFFGNVNTNDSGDNKDTFNNASGEGIGGQGIDSINFPVDAGSFAGNGAVAPITVPAIPAPTLPDGVQATYTVAYEAYAVTTGAGKTGLTVGDTFGAASLPGLIAKVTSTSGSNAVFSCDVAGASRSNSLTLAQIPQDTIGITLTKIAGSGSAGTFLTDVIFHVKSVTITEKGSGYVGTETLPSFTKPGTTNGNVPVGVLAFTTDDGIPYDPEAFPAIIAYAYVTSANQIADINKQESTRQYKVTTAEGTRKCVLKAGTPSAVGEMSINATDSAGGTYWVTKMTHNLVTLTPNTGSQFVTDTRAQWVLDTPVNGVSVKLDNA